MGLSNGFKKSKARSELNWNDVAVSKSYSQLVRMNYITALVDWKHSEQRTKLKQISLINMAQGKTILSFLPFINISWSNLNYGEMERNTYTIFGKDMELQ